MQAHKTVLSQSEKAAPTFMPLRTVVFWVCCVLLSVGQASQLGSNLAPPLLLSMLLLLLQVTAQQ